MASVLPGLRVPPPLSSPLTFFLYTLPPRLISPSAPSPSLHYCLYLPRSNSFPYLFSPLTLPSPIIAASFCSRRHIIITFSSFPFIPRPFLLLPHTLYTGFLSQNCRHHSTSTPLHSPLTSSSLPSSTSPPHFPTSTSLQLTALYPSPPLSPNNSIPLLHVFSTLTKSSSFLSPQTHSPLSVSSSSLSFLRSHYIRPSPLAHLHAIQFPYARVIQHLYSFTHFVGKL